MRNDESHSRQTITDVVKTAWCEVLGLENIDATLSFYELGGTSIAAEMICWKLGQALRVDLSGSDILRMPKLGSFIQLVDARLSAAREAEAVTA